MESLESKLDRLSPDQRREIEDFVDFLLYRSGSLQGVYSPNMTPLPEIKTASPIPVMTPMIIPEPPPVVMHEQNFLREESASDGVSEDTYSPIQEITVEVDDPISRNYLDYGQFEQQPSPATEAVKKVKRKLILKSEQDKSRHLLEWID